MPLQGSLWVANSQSPSSTAEELALVGPPESVSASVPGFTRKTQHAIASEWSTRHETRKLPGPHPSSTHHAAIGV